MKARELAHTPLCRALSCPHSASSPLQLRRPGAVEVLDVRDRRAPLAREVVSDFLERGHLRGCAPDVVVLVDVGSLCPPSPRRRSAPGSSRRARGLVLGDVLAALAFFVV